MIPTTYRPWECKNNLIMSQNMCVHALLVSLRQFHSLISTEDLNRGRKTSFAECSDLITSLHSICLRVAVATVSTTFFKLMTWDYSSATQYIATNPMHSPYLDHGTCSIKLSNIPGHKLFTYWVPRELNRKINSTIHKSCKSFALHKLHIVT